MKDPELLPFGIDYHGSHVPIYCYDEVPDGLKPVKTTDLYMGRRVMYKVITGPDKGKYYTDVVRPGTIGALLARIRSGLDVYVK